MRWAKQMNETIKRGIKNWLNLMPAPSSAIQINETADFELSAIRNRIWYRGDSSELEQLYKQNPEYADKYKFWASSCTPGMEMRKIHTGLPGLIVRVLASIVLPDMNEFSFSDPKQEEIWRNIEKENSFGNLVYKSVKDALVIGDGAFKIAIDTSISAYPIIEWYPGDRIEIIKTRGRLKEIVFKTTLYGKTAAIHPL